MSTGSNNNSTTENHSKSPRFFRTSSLVKTSKQISSTKFLKSKNSSTLLSSLPTSSTSATITTASSKTLCNNEGFLSNSMHQRQSQQLHQPLETKVRRFSRILSFGAKSQTEKLFFQLPSEVFSKAGKIESSKKNLKAQSLDLTTKPYGQDQNLEVAHVEKNCSDNQEPSSASLSVSDDDEKIWRNKGGAEANNNPKPIKSLQNLPTEQQQWQLQQEQEQRHHQSPCNHLIIASSSSSSSFPPISSLSQLGSSVPLTYSSDKLATTQTTFDSSLSQDSALATKTTFANSTQLSSSPAAFSSSFSTHAKAKSSLTVSSSSSFPQQPITDNNIEQPFVHPHLTASASSNTSHQNKPLESLLVAQNTHTTKSAQNANQLSSVADNSTSSQMLFSKPDSASATPPTVNMELSSNTSADQEPQQSNQCQDYSDMEVDSPEHIIQGISSSSNSPPPSNLANGQSLNALANTSDGATESTPTTNTQQLDVQPLENEEEEDPYSIRLTPFIDHSSTTPALYISAVERKAHNGTIIRVGRYTERKETPAPKPEHAPIVFKSKVVSRSHAQLTVQDGQWFIQDVKSSSGTFLNHVRLSPASQQSPPYALKDGDILQLGMDFRGGSEEIYKCIKVRVEVNKSWQKRVNNFK